MKKPLTNRFRLLALSLLGFAAACGDSSEVVEMYGVPRIDTRTQGRVTDKDGNPIPGIEVANPSADKKVLTAADGSYDLSSETFPYTAKLTFTDIDGEANGGEFEVLNLGVEFTQADKITDSKDTWYKGSYARTGVNVKLEEKEQE
ncbi:radical SAM-associated putative lipoprotein [uncultured Alistipes sp.]|jgi:hypothetical protein|uniref:radical SAM-associated putative lipoprotein n=1 Tax=uncultured Alistipes sp. TaxID=538949 RepID=UPI0025D4D9E4|nr:radical SAM-associated putative lipoprotein [uncultured Alistipes sp.]